MDCLAINGVSQQNAKMCANFDLPKHNLTTISGAASSEDEHVACGGVSTSHYYHEHASQIALGMFR